MIALLACMATLTGPRIIEAIDPASNRISVQILAKLPELDARELGMARVLEDVLLEDTTEFSKARLLAMTGTFGTPIRCRLMPDCIRVQFTMPKGSLAAAAAIANAVCRNASLRAEAVAASLETVPFKNRDYWVEALDPYVAKYERIRLSDLREFYRHLFRPSNLVIGVAGAFEEGEAATRFSAAFADWVPAKDTYPRYHFTDWPKPMETRRRRVATLELLADAMPENAGLNLAMASVMGLGKGSLVFRTLREKLVLSYRQEAFLWPSSKGMQLRVIVAVTDIDRGRQAAPAMRAELLAAVDAIGDGDLTRAKALLRSAWQHGFIGAPFYFDDGRPVTGGIEDKALLAAYGQMKVGTPWDTEGLLKKAEAVGLDDLKRTLKAALENAKFRAIWPS